MSILKETQLYFQFAYVCKTCGGISSFLAGKFPTCDSCATIDIKVDIIDDNIITRIIPFYKSNKYEVKL